jgi:DNA-binding NtrC family response regulator
MNLLIIDDEKDVRDSLSNFVQKLGYTVYCAKDGNDGLRKFQDKDVDLVITDIRMPGIDGIELLRRIKKIQRSPAVVIVITGHGDMDNAVKALKYGAYDYLQKPIDVRELAITLERSFAYVALRKKYSQLKDTFNQQLEKETESLRGTAEQFREAFLQEVGLGDMQVYSDAMRKVVDLAEKYSCEKEAAVLIEGESGTGKELIAKLIHYYGQEKPDAPFIAISSGAISHQLFEAELFGHESGSYTGATRRGRIGKLEAANGGTIFFDEIGEMPLSLQVKLLRVLEEKKLYRVGGIEEISIDFRIISATNKNLKQQVAKGNFRLDLFHRMNIGYIQIAALRDRPDDIVPLANHFIRKAFSRKGKRFGGFSKGAEKFLKSFPWPGNVRQLKNFMERLSILSTDCHFDREHISGMVEQSSINDLVVDSAPMLSCNKFQLPDDRFDLERFNHAIIKRALAKNKGNKTKTALYLGISRRVLQGRLKKMDM